MRVFSSAPHGNPRQMYVDVDKHGRGPHDFQHFNKNCCRRRQVCVEALSTSTGCRNSIDIDMSLSKHISKRWGNTEQEVYSFLNFLKYLTCIVTSLPQINITPTHLCHFTNKNICQNPKKLERVLIGYISQKTFRGPRNPILPILTYVNFHRLIEKQIFRNFCKFGT